MRCAIFSPSYPSAEVPPRSKKNGEVKRADSVSTSPIAVGKGTERQANIRGTRTLFEEKFLRERENSAGTKGMTPEAAKEKIRRAVRNMRIREENRRHLNQMGVLPIPHPEKNEVILGYIEPRTGARKKGERLTKGIWINPPPSIKPGQKGGFKQLTHQHPTEFVETHEGVGYVGLTAFKESAFKLSPEVRNKLVDLKLSHVVIQREVEPGFFIARRMEEDLFDRNEAGKPLPLLGFLSVLKNLKTLHENGLAHRDIKPENLMVLKEQAYLTDLDTMDFAHQFVYKNFVPGTRRYQNAHLCQHLRKAYATDPAAGARKHGEYAKIMDNYAMLITLIESERPECTLTKEQLEHGVRSSTFLPDAQSRIQDWTEACIKPEYHEHVYDLLSYPTSYLDRRGNPPHIYDMLKT